MERNICKFFDSHFVHSAVRPEGGLPHKRDREGRRLA